MRKLGISGALAAAVLGVLAAPPAVSAVAAARATALSTPPVAKGTYADVTVPRATSTEAEDITDSGLIVGCFERPNRPERGFTDQNGKFTTITHRSGGRASAFTCAAGANNAGVIVGAYANTSGVLHGFVDRHGVFRTINAPHAVRRSGAGTAAIDINKTGVIVGWFVSSGHVTRGFVLRNGKFRTVNAPGAANSELGGTVLNGIADDGTISGAFTSRDGRTHGFWLRHGVFHHINVPGARDTSVACISERSRLLVGDYRVAGRRRTFGFTFHHGVYRTMRDPSATSATIPQCGNDSGHAVRPSSTWPATTCRSATASCARSASGRACCTGSRPAWWARRCIRSGFRAGRRTGWRRCGWSSLVTAATPTSCA